MASCLDCTRVIRYDSTTQRCRECLLKTTVPPKPLPIQTIHQIAEHALSDLVVQTFKRPYSLQQQGDMMGQNEVYSESLASLENYDLDEIREEIEIWLNATPPKKKNEALWWERENYPDLEVILVALQERGLLEPGEYQIKADW